MLMIFLGKQCSLQNIPQRYQRESHVFYPEASAAFAVSEATSGWDQFYLIICQIDVAAHLSNEVTLGSIQQD